MLISLAEKNDIEEIHSLTKACASNMISNGIYQWNEKYPPKNKLSEDISRGELFCIKDESKIYGIIVITEIEDEEYENIKWLSPQGTSIYIHRLAVHPDYQRKGYAKELMDFAEGFAHSMGYTSVRLDTFSKNPRNNKFYQNRGYKKLDDIYFPKQSEHPFHCYELLL
ncbi:MAG: GNAT family N-acetyltransferase [Bacteroidota bacterium]